MKKAAWPIVAVVAVFGLGFMSAVAVRRPATVEVDTGPSAATSIVVFLLCVLLIMTLAPIGGFLIMAVLKERQQTWRMQQTALLFGAKNSPSSPRPARPAVRPGTEGGTVIMIGGGGQPRVEDMRQ